MVAPPEADVIIMAVSSSLHSATSNLESLPSLIERIIRDGLWQERIVEMTGEVVRFRRFTDFVRTPPPNGLGATTEMLKRVCKDTPTFDLIDQVLQKPAGNPNFGKANEAEPPIDNNINNSDERPVGTSQAYALRSLRKHRPDLHTRVLDGELSANAAMIEAGLRQKTVTVVYNPQSFADYILRHFTDEERAYIVRALLGLEAQS